jgi:hypothetical protein
MQTRCQHCHRPIALSKDTVHAALDAMSIEGLEHYYMLHCPHCRKLYRVPRVDLVRAAPDWKPPVQKTREPVPSEPATSKPVAGEPATSRPATSKPATSKAATSKPATSMPAPRKPATSKPVTSKPATRKPATRKPAKKK